MKVSLYNGFPFHYETFGVFLYCLTTTTTMTEIRIFTNQTDTMGWLDFYKIRFPSIQIFDMNEFKEKQFEESDFVIITTDDDAWFPNDYLKLPNAQKKILCYDHSALLRSEQYHQHITTRPYNSIFISRRTTPFMYPVYPIVPIEEKRAILEKEATINIAVVGGSWNTNHFWKFLLRNNNMSNIKIFFIHRDVPAVWNHMDRYVRSICPNTEIYKNCDTFQMLELLKRSHYIAFLTDIDKFTQHSCSGSVGLAFNTGCTMIMTRKYNSEYKFKNPIYFDDYPTLSREPNLELVYEEQAAILEHNQNVIKQLMANS